jgi:phosphoribosylformylglycinamidine synthase
MSSGLGIPFVSGNVSFYNESPKGAVAPTPTLLGIGIVDDVRRVVSSDLKSAGNVLLLVGETGRELGGSQYYSMLGLDGGFVPKPDVEKTKSLSERMLEAIRGELLASCHDLGDGGLFACLTEMCLGGDLGCEVELKNLDGLRTDFKLFSESATRWLIEVEEKNVSKVGGLLDAAELGVVCGEKSLKIGDGGLELNLSLDNLRDAWSKAVEEE